MTSPDGPGGTERTGAPVPGGPVEPPGTRGVLPGWTDRPGPVELPARPLVAATTATDPRGPRIDNGAPRTDPRGHRPPTGDLAGSLAPPSPTVTRPGGPVPRGPRRARLTVRHVDPWSVLKFTALFSICMLVIGVVAVAALYYALDRLNVFDEINKMIRDLTATEAADGEARTGGLEVYFQPKTIIGGAALLGVLNCFILTALATIGAFLYNLVSDIVGGIEVVLAERE